MLKKSRPLQIYLLPGVKEEATILRIWEMSGRRRQDIFRAMVRAGLMAMLENGDMPEEVIEECGLDALLERKRKRARKSSQVEAQQPPQYPYPQQPVMPYPWPQAMPAPATLPYPVQPPMVEAPAPVVHAKAEEPRRVVPEAQPTTREVAVEQSTPVAETTEPTPHGKKSKRLANVMDM